MNPAGPSGLFPESTALLGRTGEADRCRCALLMVASCAGAAGAQQECSWGAFSITASYENGRMIVSEPQTSGCTPSVQVASSAASVR